MKALIYTSLLLLGACSLFHETPARVVEGQRAVYQGVLIAQENDELIIKRYLEDTKAAVVYHINFVFEPRINAIREEPNLTKEEKSLQIAELEREREAQINATFVDIEKIAEDLRSRAMKNHEITKRLVESIYNYMSTSPISIDNLEFWIEKLKQATQNEPENNI